MLRYRLALFSLLISFAILTACGHSNNEGGTTGDSPGVTADYTYDAVVGESVNLSAMLFSEAAEATETAIDAKWDEIDAIYEALGQIAIPSGYTAQNVCDAVDTIPGAELIPDLVTTCETLASELLALNNLQEVVNYAADYLWASNNESVSLVDGSGMALATNEGVATITATPPGGGAPVTIAINAQEMVSDVRDLQIQNEVVVSIEDGTLQSFNADGSVKSEAPITIVSYDEVTGEMEVSGAGALLVSADQLVAIAPCDLFPDGGLRQIDSITGLLNGNISLGTSEGDMATVIQTLEMDHKESVDDTGAVESGAGDDREAGASMTLAPGVRLLCVDEFQQAVRRMDDASTKLSRAAGMGAQADTKKKFLARAAASGDWNPRYAFEFDYSDSQANESDGHGSMAVRGVIGFEMPVHFHLSYSDWKLRRFVGSFKPTQYAEIEVEVDGDADISRTLAEVRAPSIKFFIGPLPVYVRPIFEVSVHGEAEGNAVVLSVVDYEVYSKYGVDYRRGRSGPDWKPVTGYNRVFHDPEIVDGDFTLQAYGRIEPKLRFYGLGGPYARADIGATLRADTGKTDPGENWATLDSFLKVSTGVSFDVTVEVGPFDHTIIDYDKSFGLILNKSRTEWDSDGPYGGS
jgi:hypothetical protein